jgi:integrase
MSLPELPFRGAHFRQHKRGYFFLEIYDKETRRRKQVSLGEHQGVAFNQASELARRWSIGDYNPWSDRVEAIDLKDAVDLYLKRAAVDGVADGTVTRRRSVLHLFRDRHPRTRLIDLTPSDVRAFVGQPQLKGWSKYRYFTVLNRFFHVAVDEGWLKSSPMEDLKRPKPPVKRPAFLLKDEFATLIGSLNEQIETEHRAKRLKLLLWLRDFIELATYTGLRRNELRHLRWRDIDFAGGKIHVTQYEGFETKSRKDRTIPLFPQARAVLDRRKREHELVIPAVGGGVLNDRMISRQFREFREEAGIRDVIHLHSLRDTFASWLATEGVNLRLLQEWMGHESIQITERYAYLLPTDAQRYAGAFDVGIANTAELRLPQAV